MRYRNVDKERVIQHKVSHLLSAAALIGAMVVLMGLLGWVFAGGTGLVWAIALGAILTGISPRISAPWVMRMFRARPLSVQEAPSLYRMLKDLAQRAGLERLPALYYIPNQMANAFATGHRSQPAIAVSEGLLRQLSNRELRGVLAHEVSHLRHNDLWLQNLSGTIGQVTSFFFTAGQILLILNLPVILFGGKPVSLLVILVLMVAPLLSMLLQMALSRNREFSADLSAAEITGDPKGLASALTKIEQQRRGWPMRMFMLPGGNREPAPMLRTHPPTKERVRRLLALSDETQAYRSDRSIPRSGYRWIEDLW